jgi:hypothetical protein
VATITNSPAERLSLRIEPTGGHQVTGSPWRAGDLLTR